jgi:hypothetical protein
MSRGFGFVERWGCRNRTEARRSRGGSGKENPKKLKKEARWRDILKQDFGQRNEDRLYGKLAPIEVAL